MFDFATTFTGGVLAGLAAVAITFLLVTRTHRFGTTLAYQMSMRARLPFGSESVAHGVQRRNRSIVRANMWGLLVTVVVVFVVFTATPLSSHPRSMWIMATILFLGPFTASYVIASLRERLFTPAPTAMRIARAIPMQVRDYLGPWRRTTPTALLMLAVAATAGIAVSHALGHVDSGAAALTYVSLALSVAVFVLAHFAERAVLSQPQPASNTLELAWDDLFRADTLGVVRMAVAMAAWVPFGFAVSVLWSVWLAPTTPELMTIGDMLPWFGLLVLQVLYLIGGGRLPAALYPDFLTMPAVSTHEAPA